MLDALETQDPGPWPENTIVSFYFQLFLRYSRYGKTPIIPKIILGAGLPSKSAAIVTSGQAQ